MLSVLLWRCKDCGWRGVGADIVVFHDPEGDAVWEICPRCRAREGKMLGRKPGYYWVRRLNKDGQPIGEPRIAELRSSYVTWPWRSMGGDNYQHDDIQIIARIRPPRGADQ